ncbi:MAG: DUF1016 family protein [Anaerolineales bacterium]|nr:DUF1016 family protein [Anaerolineales bacterium]QYK51389.1 MAG: DUF1016 family protein [Anaerolineales bacterium]
MQRDEVVKLFNDLRSTYDTELHSQVWTKQSHAFHLFWEEKILGNEEVIAEADYDPIIKLIDVKARGFNAAEDEAIARVNLPQGTWYRIFNDLKSNKELRTTLDKIFKSQEEAEQIELINKLEEINQRNKNGLTGEKAAALNALIFLNDPHNHLSCVSLTDRLQVIDKFNLPNSGPYASYGEKIVLSTKDILQGFRAIYGIDAWPRLLSIFLYSEFGLPIWKPFQDEGEVIALPDVHLETEENEFALEKHLEDFLIANWERTELGGQYELIEEDGELVSQQYPTPIGRIDLLVKDRAGNFVVIELKRGQTSDDTIGQLARYVGWVKENLSNGKPVKGIVIARREDERLKYALKAMSGIDFFVYKVKFSLESR